MQTISVYDDDKDTNLQNLATVLTAHAVPKYFDSVVYDAEATGDDEGIRCYQDGAVVLRIVMDVSQTTSGRRCFCFKSSNSGFLAFTDGSSARHSIVDIFDNCIAIHGNGGSVGTKTDNRDYTVFLTVNDDGQSGIAFGTTSTATSKAMNSFSSSAERSSHPIRVMTFNSYYAIYADLYGFNNSYTAAASLCHYLNTDGSVVKDMYWACNRVYANVVTPHRVTVNGEQYWAMLYNSVLIKSS